MAPASATIPRMAIGCPDHGSNRSARTRLLKSTSFRAFLARSLCRSDRMFAYVGMTT